MWNDKADGKTVYLCISDFLEKIPAEAKARGAATDYVYMNYASQFQHVIRSYKPDNKGKLKRIFSN
ncbi:hypothetical protein CCHL11_06497 [Colletotrichum chlorophyti]|uniref:Uncharacterized protein n=1 Tax=Colletotrichum chlorophyti TaxID=708187 RepID=A0A1Q8RRW5_9PEZI|nr:hypothetical protein CCHL11_06497 [Colletotrichum chlorophyti]